MIMYQNMKKIIFHDKNICGGLINFILLAVLLVCMTACGTEQEGVQEEQAVAGFTEDDARPPAAPDRTALGDPVRIPLSYAEQYTLDRYDQGYVLITIAGKDRFLVVPKGMQAPENLKSDIAVIYQPADHIYLVASAAMDMFRSLDGLDAIRLSGTDADGWCMEEVTEAMESGDILYAGKYNAPDYELILSEGCHLAIENLMIDHSPEVREKLESLGIPVMVDYSSYESHPLGRVEWVKLYGVLLGKEAEAEAAFSEQMQILGKIEKENVEYETEQKTVAFFYITNNGAANVRKSSDYVPKMIELAGGKYIFDKLGDEESHSSTLTMQIEEFYAAAKDVDYIIYNSTIDGELETVDELLDKCGLLADFRAVQEGNVYCTTRNLYQESMSIGYMIDDIHKMLVDDEGMRYLYRLLN